MLAERTKPLRAALALAVVLASAATGISTATAATDPSPARVAIVVPLVVPADANAFIGADALEQYTRPTGLLTRQLDAVLNRTVAIGIDPRIIVSIRILGSSAPASAVEWLSVLESAKNETFALAWGDSDLTLATQAGSPTVLGAEGFGFAINEELFAPSAQNTDETATPNPEPSTAPDALPPLPTAKSLTAWPFTLEGLAWPRDNTVVAADLTTFAGSGFSSAILSAANVNRNGDEVAVTLDGLDAVVSDDEVSRALRAAAASASQEDWQAAVTDLSATLASAPSNVVATLDRSPLGPAGRLADTLTALEANPSVTLVPLSEALAISPQKAVLVDSPQDPASIATVTQLLAAETAERQFAVIAADPTAITDPRRLDLLALLSASWGVNPSGWAAATAAFLESSRTLRDSVQIVVNSNFTLLADSGALPISVSNELDQAVTVFITVRPQTALLAVGDNRVELIVEPNSQGKGEVPVQAISNGTVQILVTLNSSAGVQVGAPTVAEINVQAGWETPIVLVLAAIVVIVFAVGIVRNILRRRKPDAND